MKRWMLKRSKVDTVKMAGALGISQTIACILANRGIGTYEDACRFLKADISTLYPSEKMADLEKGISILAEGIEKGEKIAVYGDYDVDGVSSTVILYKALAALGADVIYYVPHRQKEGYGLNIEAVEELHREGVQILLTCDNGIAARQEIKRAKELSMTAVIIDHHEPAFEDRDGHRQDVLPEADAVIDPKRKDCPYPFKMLCAAGLSYKFASALYRYMGRTYEGQEEALVFACIATVCDIVDLMDENRTIVRCGLEKIGSVKNKGLQALIEATGLRDKRIGEYHLGFVIGPCINATGRLESARLAIRLFIEEEEGQAQKMAKELVEMNNSRKDMTMVSVEKVTAQVESSALNKDRVLVIYQEDIHESIAGIVAGKIKERYYKPVIVITKSEGCAKGSARSIEGYNIFEELFALKELFIKFGGHPMAAGLSLPHENIDILRRRLNENCTLTQEDLTEVIRIEKQLSFGDLTLPLAYGIKDLAPFGKGNSTPVFGMKNVMAERITLIGKNKDMIRFTFLDRGKNRRLTGLSFDGFRQFEDLTKPLFIQEEYDKILLGGLFRREMDILFTLDINEYNGSKSLQLMIKDFRYSVS